MPDLEPVAQLQGVDRYCQKGEGVPEDAARLRLLIGTHYLPTPTIRLSARTPDGERIAVGRLPGGRTQGHVMVPVRRVGRGDGHATVCLRITSAIESVLYGVGGRVRFEWLRSPAESWWARLPVVADSFSFGKANPIGSALFPVVALLCLLLVVAAARLAIRELRR